MDTIERRYLKRVRDANPDAEVVLPPGFYDSEEEEEKKR